MSGMRGSRADGRGDRPLFGEPAGGPVDVGPDDRIGARASDFGLSDTESDDGFDDFIDTSGIDWASVCDDGFDRDAAAAPFRGVPHPDEGEDLELSPADAAELLAVLEADDRGAEFGAAGPLERIARLYAHAAIVQARLQSLLAEEVRRVRAQRARAHR